MKKVKNTRKTKGNPECLDKATRKWHELKLAAIQEKIDKRKEKGKKWEEENIRLRQQTEAIKSEEDANIKELDNLHKSRIISKLEKRNLVKDLQQEILDVLLSCNRAVFDQETNNSLIASQNAAQILELESKLDAIMKFKAKKEELEQNLKDREIQMEVSASLHQERLKELITEREKFEEAIKIETKEEIGKFPLDYSSRNVAEGAVFVEKSKLVDEYEYLKEQSALMKQQLPSLIDEIVRMRAEGREIDAEVKEYLENTPIESIAATSLSETASDSSRSASSQICSPANNVESELLDDICSKEEIIKLRVILEEARKAISEALALKLVPEGAMEEEKLMTDEQRTERFQQRRYQILLRKAAAVRYFMQVLGHRHPVNESRHSQQPPEESKSDTIESSGPSSPRTVTISSDSSVAMSASPLLPDTDPDFSELFRRFSSSRLSFDQYQWTIEDRDLSPLE